MGSHTIYPELTNNDLHALFRETGRQFQESREQIQETGRQLLETKYRLERLIQSQEKTEQFIKETNLQMLDLKQSEKRLGDKLGGMANSHGSFAEEYFYNSFDRGERIFFGEKFDEIEKGLKYRSKKLQAEYDIVMYNCTSVAIIEVKYKAHENDLPQILNKIETFRKIYPDYKNYKIYLGIASMAFYPELEQACIDNGIAMIKQVGGKVVIQDKHRKAF